MITRADLRKTAREYLAAAALLRNRRKYDVAVYVCGYAVEIALKERTCRTLRWASFPETANEFKSLSSLKTHNLEVLLRLSGVEDKIKSTLSGPWAVVTKWDPEQRYNPRGTKSPADADDMIEATKNLLKALL